MNAFTDIELRVLGALVEKQISTPAYYPLTLNALVNACNQKNHREPVVSYVESEVLRAIEGLRNKGLAFVHEGAESRVLKYGHNFPKALNLTEPETAVLCVLMLRGPQTPGELRSRTPHLFNFESLAAVDETLQQLAARENPLVAKLPRAPGTKESRFAHLLGGPVQVEAAASSESVKEPAASSPVETDRLAKLEAEVAQLRQELGELKTKVAEFEKRPG